MINNIISIESKLLKNLPTTDFAKRIMALAGPDRLRSILDRKDAQAVVTAMPPQDFYLTIKEPGVESTLPILSMATSEQITYILDIEGWDRDNILPGRMLEWCARLLAAGETKFLAWLYSADFELLVLLFKQWLDVQPALEEDEQPVKLESLDNVHYFTIRYPDYREILIYTLRYLFENHQPFYLELFRHSIGALNIELEEEAARFHRGRLAENAIPDSEEAASIYFPLKKQLIVHHHKEALEDYPSPSFALALLPAGNFFQSCLSSLSLDSTSIQMELTGLANKIMVADRLPADDPASLKTAVDKAVSWVSLGLEILSHGNRDQATVLLQEIYLEDFFRHGYTCIQQTLQDAKRMIKTGWLNQWPHGINILDSVWQEPVSLLLEATPMLLKEQGNERLITSYDDLQNAEDIISIIKAAECLFHIISQGDTSFWKNLNLWEKSQNPTLETVTIGTMLFTAAATAISQNSWQLKPLAVKDWHDIAPRLAPENISRILDKEVSKFCPEQEEAVHHYLQPLLAQYSIEMGDMTKIPDPALVPYFLFI